MVNIKHYKNSIVMKNKILRASDSFIKQITQTGETQQFDSLQWLLRRAKSGWFPRDIDAVCQYLIERLGDKPFYIYGAGTHTVALLKKLSGSKKINNLLGIIDRQAKKGQKLESWSVYSLNYVVNKKEPLVLSHQAFEDSMYDDLLNCGVVESRIITVYLNQQYGEQCLADFNATKLLSVVTDTEPNKKRLVFINARSCRIMDDKVIEVLKSENQYQLINIKMDHLEVDQIDPSFDVTLNAQNSLLICLQLTEQLKPDLICVQEHYATGNYLPLLIALAFPKHKVIGEFYDFLALTFDDPMILNEESYWHKNDVKLAVEAESWCIENLTGIVTKESGPVLSEFLKKAQVLKFPPFISKNFHLAPRANCHQPARLIWAGRITESRLSSIMYGDNQIIDVFQDLVKLGFPVTAYTTSKDPVYLKNNYQDYLELAKQDLFDLNLAMPIHDLLKLMAEKYDYGLLLGRPCPNTQQLISHKVTVSAKLSTYLAAGLPVIIGSYLEIMAKWVSDNGLGIVVDTFDIKTLPGLIKQADYQAMTDNIIQYREVHHLENAVSRFNQFFRDCSEY